jgi:hypothetical protein
MDSLTGSSGDPVLKHEVRSPQGGPVKLMQRLLHRKGSLDGEAQKSPASIASGAKRTVIDRLEGFFVQDLPSEMGNFPDAPEEPSPAGESAIVSSPRSSADAKTSPQANEPTETTETSAYSAVRQIRTAAKEAIARSQEAYREIELNLKKHAQEILERREMLSATEAATAARLQELGAKTTLDVSSQLEKASQSALEKSTQRLEEQSDAAAARSTQQGEAAAAALALEARNLAASLQELRDKTAKDLTETAQQAFRAVLAGSSQQLQQQSEAAVRALQEKFDAEKQRFVSETQTQFDNLRASRQSFLEDTRKEVTAAVEGSLDGLVKSAVEKARAELEASRESFINESQAQLVSTFRSSLDLLAKDVTKDLVERARTELDGSRQAFMSETQSQLDRTVRASVEQLRSQAAASTDQAAARLSVSQQRIVSVANEQLAATTRDWLESEMKNAVDRGRQELGNMVDGFLAKVVPQIQVELEKLVSRHMENIRAQGEPEIVAHEGPQTVPWPNAAGPASAPASAPPSDTPQIDAAAVATPQAARALLSEAARVTRAPATTGRAPTTRFSALQIDPMAITTSQLAHARVSEPARAAPRPAPSTRPPERGLDFRLAESAPKQHRIEVRELKEGISSGLKLGVGLGIVALLISGVYFALTPVIRLRPNPPAGFLEDSPTWSAQQRVRESQLARSYWQLALTQIEPQYGFGSTLPANAPDEFRVPENGPSGASADADARARYWEKLREVWAQPDSWERMSRWDLDSFRIAWNNALSKIGRLFGSQNTSPTP